MRPSIVLVPGAWTGAWGWKLLEDHLAASGVPVHALTLSGLDDRSDASDIDLSTHVADVSGFVVSNRLSNVVLVGHSYSGIVIGLASQNIRERLSHLVFVEAFLPVGGKSLLECAELDVEEETQAIRRNGGRWPAPTRAELAKQPYLSEEDKDWLSRNFLGHPGKSVTDTVPSTASMGGIASTFVGKSLPSEEGGRFQGMRFVRLEEAGHWPMIARPRELATILLEIAR